MRRPRSISARARARSRIRWWSPIRRPAAGGSASSSTQGSEKLVEMHARLMDGDNPAHRDLDLPLDSLTARTPASARCRTRRRSRCRRSRCATAPARAPRPPSSPRAMGLRRFVVIGGAVALTGRRRTGDVPRLRGERPDRAGGLHAGAVPRAVRLDRAVVHQRARRLLSRCSAAAAAGSAPGRIRRCRNSRRAPRC